MKRLTRVASISTAAIALAGAALTAQTPAPAAGPTLITVAVTSSDGRPVRGLSAPDFTVVEDGQQATITSVRAMTESGVLGSHVSLMEARRKSTRASATPRQSAGSFSSSQTHAEQWSPWSVSSTVWSPLGRVRQ